MSSCAISQTTALPKSFVFCNLSTAANCPAIPAVLRNIEDVAAVAIATTGQAHATTCSGELWKTDSSEYMIDGCNLLPADAKKVLQICAAGRQCEVTGTLKHCKGVRGACANITRLTDIRWGTSLPVCAPSAAADRANEWWNGGGSVNVKGTIVRSKGENKPYGHTQIVMGLTTCSNGARMTVVRVPEKWIGHYVDLGGDPMRIGNEWYIISRSIEDARSQ